MKLSKIILKLLLISLLIFVQCTSKKGAEQKQEGQTDLEAKEKVEEAEKIAPIVFECNFFDSPKPGSLAELFAPEVFKGEEHQHSSPTFSPDGSIVLFASDRGGSSQLFEATGGELNRPQTDSS